MWRLSGLFLLLRLAMAGQQQEQSLDEYLRLVRSLPLPSDNAAPRSLNLIGPSKVDPRLQASLSARSLDSGGVSICVRATGLTQIPAVLERIRSVHGEATATFENTVWAIVPADAVAALAAMEEVSSVTGQPVYPDEPDPNIGTNSRTMAQPADGVRAAHLDVLHRRGITGIGVKIGMIDRGFGGYDDLVRQKKARAAAAQASFPAATGVFNRDRHGAACAEIVSAAAPGAELYLAAFDGTQGQLVAAANWLIGQGVTIINYSAGNAVTPTDGEDALSRFLDFTSQTKGILWVIAAGNHAEQHWTGETGPASGDLKFDGEAGLAIQALAGTLGIVVRWSDWGADPRTPSATQDIDAYLYDLDTHGRLHLVAQSALPQNGGGAQPVEMIQLSGPGVPGHRYFLVLRTKHLTRKVRVHVFLEPGGAGRLYPSMAQGSILSPASAKTALAVGAWDVVSNRLAHYSSQGPTDDGRLKPEVTAPTNTISWLYAGQGERFTGTSASAPHAAGFAALLKQISPEAPAFELRTRLMASTVAPGPERPAFAYGYGEIDATAIEADNTPHARDISIEGLTVAIPPEFGGAVRVKTLAALLETPAAAHDGLTVQVVSDRSLYFIGDSLKLHLHATETCACLLFARNAHGEFAVVPNGGGPEILLRRGEELELPSEEGTTLEVAGPAGRDDLLLVCAHQPESIEALFAQSKSAALTVAAYSYQVILRK